MNHDIRDIKVIHQFISALEQAGFSTSCHDFVNIMHHLHFKPQEGLLREFFLAYEGLAEFRIKPGVIKMLREYPSFEEVEKFRKDVERHDRVLHLDDRDKFVTTIDQDQLRLLSPLRRGEYHISLGVAIERISAWHSHIWGTVWQARWFSLHQEFLPENWITVLKQKGRIYFPGARLVSKDRHGRPDKIEYPFLEESCGDRIVSTEDRDGDVDVDRDDFFVSVGRKVRPS
ncbi:MAG: hypothetical protein WC027_02160 [Candidatus Paceibacterota bacterium]